MLYIESHVVLVGYRQSRVLTDEVPLLVQMSAELTCFTAFHSPSSSTLKPAVQSPLACCERSTCFVVSTVHNTVALFVYF